MKVSKDIYQLKSVSQFHQKFDSDKPNHPLISIVDVSEFEVKEEEIGQRWMSDLYQISIKDSSCGMIYGRNQYDFDEGVLVLTGPKQIMTPTSKVEKGSISGKMLIFHPDILAGTGFSKQISKLSYWSYDNHEALHLSKREENTLLDLFSKLEEEINGNLDDFSQKLIVSNLSLITEYCSRFYNRQFITRKNSNKDVVSEFEKHLSEYFDSEELTNSGLPSVNYLSEKVFLSPHYLSDLLKKETGRTIKDHVNDFVIEKAKDILLTTNDPVSAISYDLGFNYPHYFSRLFKSKTGMSPAEFRNVS